MPNESKNEGSRPLHDRLSTAALNPSPSLYIRRLPAMLVAGLGLAMSAFSFDAPGFRAADSLVISALTLSLLLSFIGGEDRWRTNPWIVLLNGLVVGPVSFCGGIWLMIHMQGFGTWSVQGAIESALSIVLVGFLAHETSAAFRSIRKAHRTGA